MQDSACAWNSLSPCGECKKNTCLTCENQESCDSCVMESESTCFAFCDFRREPVLNDVNIDFPEKYAVIRCKKARKAEYDPDYYPGFCVEHCQKYYQIQNAYKSLNESSKKAIHYMISSQVCDLLNISVQLNLTQPYTTFQLFQLINSPLGYMSVNPMYFTLFFESFLQEKFVREFIFKSPSPQQTEKIFRDTAKNDYLFLLNLFLTDTNMTWLNDTNKELKVLNWNMMYYKISSMFLMCLNPQFVCGIPSFSENWQEKWQGKWNDSIKRKIPEIRRTEDIETIALWDNFLYMMSFVADLVNEHIANPNRPDGAPKEVENITQTYQVVSQNVQCKKTY